MTKARLKDLFESVADHNAQRRLASKHSQAELKSVQSRLFSGWQKPGFALRVITGYVRVNTGCVRVNYGLLKSRLDAKLRVVSGCVRVNTGFVRVKPGFRQATCFPASNFCTKMIKKADRGFKRSITNSSLLGLGLSRSGRGILSTPR